MTRAELDALIDRALIGIVDAVDPDSEDALSARQEAQLLDAEARAFADAVDRDRKRLDYGEAVMLDGPHGVAVCTAKEYADAPVYWHTVVGGPEAVIKGPELMQALTSAARRGATPAP